MKIDILTLSRDVFAFEHSIVGRRAKSVISGRSHHNFVKRRRRGTSMMSPMVAPQGCFTCSHLDALMPLRKHYE